MACLLRSRASSENPPKGGFSAWGRHTGGFTTLELIVVILIVSVLAAVSLPKLMSTGLDERGFRDRVLASLRYAQKSAIAAHRVVCVTFSGDGAQFKIAKNFADTNCDDSQTLIGPNGVALNVSADGKASFVGTPSAIQFDTAGRTNPGRVISINGLPANLAITVEAETGYVH
ncbi:Tfp pilus assembly protein FimT/FimU [Azonexus sp. IMCC34839]|uniref:pilus assembly FimT family protein n=1 Tax=Azonexus sp. IMCC34839 TaxID=3133695 RepID=UPI00399BE15F